MLAMYAGEFRDGVYSRGHESPTVRRFVAYVADDTQRGALAQLFGATGSLVERLERAYSAVRGDQWGFDAGPARHFLTDQ